MARTANNSSDAYGSATANGAPPDSEYGIISSVSILAAAIVLFAAAAVIRSWLKRSHEKSTGPRVPSAPRSTTSPSATVQIPLSQFVPVIFAAVVRATQARTAAGVPEKAAALFHGAVMCWIGSELEWGLRAAEMGLSQLPSWSPEGDDRVVATYRAEMPADETPRNFLSIQRSLNKLASNGSLKRGALYGRPVGIDPSRYGFK